MPSIYDVALYLPVTRISLSILNIWQSRLIYIFVCFCLALERVDHNPIASRGCKKNPKAACKFRFQKYHVDVCTQTSTSLTRLLANVLKFTFKVWSLLLCKRENSTRVRVLVTHTGQKRNFTMKTLEHLFKLT